MKKVTIKNMDGTMEEVELLNAFDINDINKDFVILSKGEKVNDTHSKIYISEVIEEQPGVYKLLGISDPSVWEKVKMKMKEIVTSNTAQGGE